MTRTSNVYVTSTFISLLFKSKFPPSCGRIFNYVAIPPPPSLAVAAAIAVTCPLLSRVISCINVLPLLSEELAALIVGWSVLLTATKELQLLYHLLFSEYCLLYQILVHLEQVLDHYSNQLQISSKFN